MIRKLLILSLLLVAPYARAAFVHGSASTLASAAAQSAPAITVTSGNLIIARTKTGSTATGATVVLSSAGVTCTWSTAAPLFGSTFSAAIGVCVPSSSGSMTVTATWSGQTGGLLTDITVEEDSPPSGFIFNSSSLVDGAAVSTTSFGGTTTNCTSGSVTTANANDLLMGACFNWNAAQSYGVSTGFSFQTLSSRNTTGAYNGTGAVSAGSYTFTTTVASDLCTAFILPIKLTATGGGAVTRGKAVVF